MFAASNLGTLPINDKHRQVLAVYTGIGSRNSERLLLTAGTDNVGNVTSLSFYTERNGVYNEVSGKYRLDELFSNFQPLTGSLKPTFGELVRIVEHTSRHAPRHQAIDQLCWLVSMPQVCATHEVLVNTLLAAFTGPGTNDVPQQPYAKTVATCASNMQIPIARDRFREALCKLLALTARPGLQLVAS